MLIDDGELVMRRMSCPLKAVVEMRGCIADYEVWSNFKLLTRKGNFQWRQLKALFLSYSPVYWFTNIQNCQALLRFEESVQERQIKITSIAYTH